MFATTSTSARSIIDGRVTNLFNPTLVTATFSLSAANTFGKVNNHIVEAGVKLGGVTKGSVKAVWSSPTTAAPDGRWHVTGTVTNVNNQTVTLNEYQNGSLNFTVSTIMVATPTDKEIDGECSVNKVADIFNSNNWFTNGGTTAIACTPDVTGGVQTDHRAFSMGATVTVSTP